MMAHALSFTVCLTSLCSRYCKWTHSFILCSSYSYASTIWNRLHLESSDHMTFFFLCSRVQSLILPSELKRSFDLMCLTDEWFSWGLTAVSPSSLSSLYTDEEQYCDLSKTEYHLFSYDRTTFFPLRCCLSNSLHHIKKKKRKEKSLLPAEIY